MAQIAAVAAADPPPPPPGLFLLRKLFGRNQDASGLPSEAPTDNGPAEPEPEGHVNPDLESDADDHGPGLSNSHRRGRPVVPGLPRAQTFKRQQSEKRVNLAPVEPTPDERRAVSVDRRFHQARSTSQPASQQHSFPRSSAPELLDNSYELQAAPSVSGSLSNEKLDQGVPLALDGNLGKMDVPRYHDLDSAIDPRDAMSETTSQFDAMIHHELEHRWILNLSMHFRDKSKREKFFVTYRENRENDHIWRRVTISLDYRNAPENSLELELAATKYQRDKSAKMYESIRESLQDIQFYDTVTNLKLQTTDGRLHVHVVEDTNEIINYPTVRQVQHLGCRRIRESEIDFDAHMSGFVYRVHVNGEILIKKEIPGPETVDEFLYEINALHSLRDSRDVIRFKGVVVDEQDENVKGLLISYADQGALVDVLFDNRQDSELGTPWPIRERWARQIVQGLADIHECGFVQGDFTLSNIVIDDRNDAKIIDINRRGCPVGWEPPEATALIESGQRLSMYIGVKSDLFQLGMVLWALATQEDEPEIHGRPLQIDPELSVPGWFEEIVRTCLSSDPRQRLQAVSLLSLFPPQADSDTRRREAPTSISVDDGYSMQEYFVESYNDEGQPGIKAVKPPSDWSYVNLGHATKYPQDPYRRSRGRSPPSPLPSHLGQFDHFGKNERLPSWARGEDMPHSYSDVSGDNASDVGRFEDLTPTTAGDVIATPETLAAHLPTVVLENEDGLVDVAAADNSGVMTPESLAVEHHFYGTEPDAAKTPTPRPREVKEHSFIEGWVRSTSPGSPTSIPMPTSSSSAVDGELVHDIRSLVLEPVPDDLPRLDGKSELVTVVAVEPEAVSLVEESALLKQKLSTNCDQNDQVVLPEIPAAAQEEATNVQDNLAVEQKESVIGQEEPAVAQAGSVVAQEESTITQDQSAVAQDLPPTAQEESTVLQEDPAVLQQTTTVTQNEPTIVGEDHLVDQKNPIIGQEEPAAAQEGSAIVLDEPAIVQDGSIAIQEEPAVQEELAVDQREPAISHEEPTVAEEKSAAIPAESTVVVQEEQTVEQKEATAVPDDLAIDPKEPGVSQEEPITAQEASTGMLEESVAVVQEEPAVDQGGPVVDRAEPNTIASDDPAVGQNEVADDKEDPVVAQEQTATVQEGPAVAQEEKAGIVQEAPAIIAQETEQKASEDSVLREQETELEKKDEVQTKQELSADQAQEAPLPLALDSGITAPEGAPDHSNGPQSDESASTAKSPQPEAEAVVVVEVEGEKGQADAEAPLDVAALKTANMEACPTAEVEKQPEEPATTSTPEQAVVVVEAEVASPSAPTETAALEGIGAAHIAAGGTDGELREKELGDDDLLTPMTAAVEVSTATPLTTTTATTEGSGIIPAL